MKPTLPKPQTNEPDTKSRQVDDSGMLNYVARDDWSLPPDAPKSRGKSICRDRRDLYDAYIEAFVRPSVHRPVDPDEEIPFDVKDRLWQL